MLLNIVKYKSLKNAINKAISKPIQQVVSSDIKTVGVILDSKCFSEIDLIKQELIERGILNERISFLIYNKTKNGGDFLSISSRDFTTFGCLKNPKVISFLEKPFDLLINYYDDERVILIWANTHSKAKFKVGFSSVKSRVNTFSIALSVDKYKEYIGELFRYLEIFKKK